MTESILEVNELDVHFTLKRHMLSKNIVHAVNGVTLQIKKGETLGLVGESGCGKSTLAKAIIRLYEPTKGEIKFSSNPIHKIAKKDLKPFRKQVQMIFQDPFESLNPRHTIGHILEEPFIIHKLGGKKERLKRVKELLNTVELSTAVINKYPHEFSGGQRQRIGIARAIALSPDLLICDEPVSALDVSVQSQILNLLLKLQKQLGLTMLFISHDLAVVKHVADRIAVMYLGKIVEIAQAETLMKSPKHPYTQALFSAIPKPVVSDKREGRIILNGEIPSPINFPAGCVFASRCPYVKEECKQSPELRELSIDKSDRHEVACHFSENLTINT